MSERPRPVRINRRRIDIFAELPSKIFVNQMSADARAAEADGGDEGDYDEDDEDNHHGIYATLLYIYNMYMYMYV